LVIRTNGHTAYFNDATLAFSTTPLSSSAAAMGINSNRSGAFGVDYFADPGMYGYIADFRMYGTALSVGDIGTIFNNGSS
jgi:hypothetical protein